MLAEQYRPKSVASGIKASSYLVAAYVAILVCGNFAQGKGSSDVMIPPRHRPYFETKHLPPQEASTANDVSIYHYDTRHSLYHEGLTKDVNWAVSFVQKKSLYNGHVISRRSSKDDPQTEKCKEFTQGNQKRKEFYSPNYPGNYPSNTECIRLLEAEPGHILKLDFRNTFDVEYSNNCTYDYLEVRDGGHGYDRLIGQFCGNIFPDIIGSTSRYLWLRFKSDDTIEGAGFTAVYESILPSNGRGLATG